jgi:hypothetical protein
LADQAGRVLRLGQSADECARSGAGHGSEIVDQLLPAHADPAVHNGQGSRLGVGPDADHERAAVGEQLRPVDAFVAQLVAGVRGVGDQLAQEYVRLGIDGVNHEAEQFGHFRLKGMGLGRFGSCGHEHPGAIVPLASYQQRPPAFKSRS